MTRAWRRKWWRIEVEQGFRFKGDRRILVKLDRELPWWWTRSLGGQYPRWLRRTWCGFFHWRHLTTLVGFTSCAIVGSPRTGLPTRLWFYKLRLSFLHNETVYEHIRTYGCYQCQFGWWRRRSYDTNTP